MWTRLTSILVLIAIGIITLFFTYQFQYLRFNFEVERLFPMEHEETHFYNQFRQEFGNDSDYIIIGITKQMIYDSLFLSKINQLSKGLKNLEQVVHVLSPTEIKEVLRIKFPPKIIETPFFYIGFFCGINSHHCFYPRFYIITCLVVEISGCITNCHNSKVHIYLRLSVSLAN